MTSLTKVHPLIVAVALMLAGCALPKPELYVDPFTATGKPKPGFARDEVPTLYCNLAAAQTTGALIKVRRDPDGITLQDQYVPPTPFTNEGTTSLDLNQRNRSDSSYRIPFPGLDNGDYIAELWIKGRLENTLKFSVSGRIGAPANLPLPRANFPLPPGMARHVASTGSPSINRFAEQAIDRLDALVGLTDPQKTAVMQIYLDDYAKRPPPPKDGDAWPAQAAFQHETKARIRALLSPEQQKLYDDDSLVDIFRNQRLDKLDLLVRLSPEQKIEAGKIFDEEKLALGKFTSLEERGVKGADIRKNTRAQIRALLTPAQQKIYDETPQRLGGGASRIATTS